MAFRPTMERFSVPERVTLMGTPVYEYIFTRKKIGELSTPISNPLDAIPHLRSRLEGLEQEHFIVLSLNTKNHIIDSKVLYIGHLSGANVRIGEVFRDPVRHSAASIMIAHNHPSGDPNPSGPDVSLTSEIQNAGKLFDIPLMDHIIIGEDGRFVSIRQTNPFIFG